MMLLCACVLMLIAIIIWYLKTEVVTQKSFTIDSVLAGRLIFEFLKVPTNLERIHPRIQKVSNIHSEDNATRFQIEEDMGSFFGKKSFPMKLMTFCDESNTTSSLRFDSHSIITDVMVTLAIIDYDTTKFPATQDSFMPPHSHPSSTIKGCVRVKSMRIVSFFICVFLLSIWDKTIRRTLDILNEESGSSDVNS